MKRLLSVVPATALLLVAACDTSGGDAAPDTPHSIRGEATFGPDQGVDFGTGHLTANISASDLFATGNGDALRLTAGGPDQPNARGATWHRAPGQPPTTFDSLDEVPSTPLPAPNQNAGLPKAKTGHGFIIENQRNGFTRGWISEATATSVTVEFGPIPSGADE